MSAPSRNAPCPCGSGVKYKKCCLPKDEADRAAQAPRGRLVQHRGNTFSVSGDPTPETLDLAADHFERKDAGEGYASQMARFAQPLIDAAGDDPAAVQNAMTLGSLLWNVSIVGDEADGMIADLMSDMNLDGEAATEFRSLATSMVERHKEMFPALHAELRRMRASAEG